MRKSLFDNLKLRKKAEQLLRNPAKLSRFLDFVKKTLEKGADVPLFGRYFEDMATMIDLLEDYVAGHYRSIPHRFVVAIVIAMIYMVNPIDVLPDFIPILGQLDDIAVIQLILMFGLDAELIRYRKWKVKQTALQYGDLGVEPDEVVRDVVVDVDAEVVSDTEEDVDDEEVSDTVDDLDDEA